MAESADAVIVGAGAAGLMAATWAGRTVRAVSPARNPTRPRIIVLDSARTLGAKILVAGGGRCNVTHHEVDERAYAGSSRNAIKKVLRRFDVPRTVAFFRELGVDLKREETGKLFPTTDKARTVLDALLGAVGAAGCEIRHPCRVESVRWEPTIRPEEGRPSPRRVGDTDGGVASVNGAYEPPVAPAGRFIVSGPWGELAAPRLVLATGGMSLPKTGSDGHGYTLARSLGHSLTPRINPALVPLTLHEASFIRTLSGLTLDTTLELRSSTGKRLAAFTNSTLCTHFGLSGPGPLDISRYYLDALADDPGARLVINWLPGETTASADAALLGLGQTSPLRSLAARLPERLARALCEHAASTVQLDASAPGHRLTREARRALATAVAEMPLPVTGTRGFAHAEVTAGGVPLAELRLETMESRVRAGLHLCGEICDVDGRIGGFNFQWAWASGYAAGVSVLTPHAAPPRDALAVL